MNLKLVLALALMGLALAPTLDAKRIYSFRDEKGVMHFSDSPPAGTTAPVDERLVKVDNKQMVFLREDGPKEDRRYTIWNGYGGPIEVLLAFEKSDNVVSQPPLPASVVVPGQQNTLVMQVQPLDPKRGWSYQWNYRYVHGDPAARHDPTAEYRLPFDDSLSLRVGQAFNGTYSHTHEQSSHAVDIGMEEGTPVLAARAGIVMSSETDFYASGTDLSKFGSRANEIRILHDDGTMAVYAHLALESVIVSIGDRVKAGQAVAKSGNTGFSTGPHLHFAIQRNRGGALVSIPFEFTVNGEKVTPVEGMVLGAQ